MSKTLEQALVELEVIETLLTASATDWDRWEELSLEIEDPDVTWEEEDAEEYAELKEIVDDYKDADGVFEAIHNNYLEVLYRTLWKPSKDFTDVVPNEFQILLTTGGPAVRIIGSLDDEGTPDRAWFEYSDWGIPWKELGVGQEAALEYAKLVIRD